MKFVVVVALLGLVLLSGCSNDDEIIMLKNIENIYSDTLNDLNNPHMYGLSTNIGITTAGEVSQWQTIDFNADISDIQYLTFEDVNTVVIPEDGHYTIVFGAGFQDSAANPVSMVGIDRKSVV